MPPRDPEAAGISASDSPKLPARHLNEVQRFASMLRETVFGLDALPPSVCPNDEAVVSFWFRHRGRPAEDLLRVMGRMAPIRLVGSRLPNPVRPGSSECAAEWFVAATRASFRRVQQGVAAWRPSQRRAAVVGAVVRVTPPVPNQRLRVRWTEPEEKALEVVLHAGNGAEDRHIVEGFRRYLRKLDLWPYCDRVLFARRLAFWGLKADAREALDVARFAFVRMVREMPRLRLRRPTPPDLGYLRSMSLFGVLSPPSPTEDAAPHLLRLPPTPIEGPGCAFSGASVG